MADNSDLRGGVSVSDLARMVRLSRSSIQYYEKIGVLDPANTDGRHRYTAHDDIQRLTSAVALHNLGVELGDIVPLLDDEPFSERHLLEYRASVERRRAYLDAQIEMVDRYVALYRDDGAIRMLDVEPAYYTPTVPWSSEAGTSEAGDDPMYVPVSGLGAVFGGDDPASPTSVRTGRAVFVRFAPLISGFGEGMDVIGGCTCLTAVLCANVCAASNPQPVDWDPLFARLREHMRVHGLRAAGQAFVPYGLSIYGVPRVLVCLPVERAGIVERLLGRR